MLLSVLVCLSFVPPVAKAIYPQLDGAYVAGLMKQGVRCIKVGIALESAAEARTGNTKYYPERMGYRQVSVVLVVFL